MLVLAARGDAPGRGLAAPAGGPPRARSAVASGGALAACQHHPGLWPRPLVVRALDQRVPGGGARWDGGAHGADARRGGHGGPGARPPQDPVRDLAPLLLRALSRPGARPSCTGARARRRGHDERRFAAPAGAVRPAATEHASRLPTHGARRSSTRPRAAHDVASILMHHVLDQPFFGPALEAPRLLRAGRPRS